MAFVEEKENSNRAWYGGGLGFIGFDGTINTGLTLRTVRIKAGVAEVRAGATLLFDSEVSERSDTYIAWIRRDDQHGVDAQRYIYSMDSTGRSTRG